MILALVVRNTDAFHATFRGGYYFVACVGLTLAGIFEWVIGNTFPSVVFMYVSSTWYFSFLYSPGAKYLLHIVHSEDSGDPPP